MRLVMVFEMEANEAQWRADDVAEVEADWNRRRQAWHTADYYPYIHTAHRMGL